MKRVLTAIGPDGKSHIVSGGAPDRILRLSRLPGLEFAEIWGTDDAPDVAAPEGEILLQQNGSLVPGPAGTRFRIVTLPPDRSVAQALSDPDNAMALIGEIRSTFPGIGDAGELTDPAMHATPTLDYGVILSGEVVLELDSGETATMRAGDCVVQIGARHAWRNRSDQPCVIAFVMVGAASELLQR